MKRIALASAVLILASGAASAHTVAKKPHGFHGKSHAHVNVKKRRTSKPALRKFKKIVRHRGRIAKIRRWARTDGKVTYRERLRLKKAQANHRRLVRGKRRN